MTLGLNPLFGHWLEQERNLLVPFVEQSQVEKPLLGCRIDRGVEWHGDQFLALQEVDLDVFRKPRWRRGAPGRGEGKQNRHHGGDQEHLRARSTM